MQPGAVGSRAAAWLNGPNNGGIGLYENKQKDLNMDSAVQYNLNGKVQNKSLRGQPRSPGLGRGLNPGQILIGINFSLPNSASSNC